MTANNSETVDAMRPIILKQTCLCRKEAKRENRITTVEGSELGEIKITKWMWEWCCRFKGGKYESRRR